MATSICRLLVLVAFSHLLEFGSATRFTRASRAMADIPSYVFEYAPLVWLHSEDPYFPSDIGAQLAHTQPRTNFVAVQGAPSPLTLDNLASLNSLGGPNIFLTSVDDVTTNPAWLNGVKPDSAGKTNGAISAAVIVNDRGSGNVDVFYMYFFAFNRGNTVFGREIGSHVGDWEHNMIRFKDGKPQSLWYSQHAYGQAFTYGAVEKRGPRPIAYVAKGAHAIYAIDGPHDHTIPGLNLFVGPLQDYTDKGTLWDPVLSAYFYKFDAGANTFTAYDGKSPTNYLLFTGLWGDEKYPDSDPRQQKLFGLEVTAKFSGGPRGPLDKQLNRPEVCMPNDKIDCIVTPFLRP